MPGEPVDFVIITALDEEREAVLSYLDNPKPLDKQDGDVETYYEAVVRTTRDDHATYRVLVTSLTKIGPEYAAIRAASVLHRWRPRYVLMVGIAGGISGQVELGDVIVADQIADYSAGKVL